MMKIHPWIAPVGFSLGVLSTGLALNSFLLPRFETTTWFEPRPSTRLNSVSLPPIEITFLRCGNISIPKSLAVRGATSLVHALPYIVLLIAMYGSSLPEAFEQVEYAGKANPLQ